MMASFPVEVKEDDEIRIAAESRLKVKKQSTQADADGADINFNR